MRGCVDRSTELSVCHLHTTSQMMPTTTTTATHGSEHGGPEQGVHRSEEGAALVNLCVEPFVVCCEATSVNADGYPPSNLTSSDPAARARGFQMEHFVKPPVSLEVRFSHAARLAFLVLQLPLPEGAECHLEVFGSPGGQNLYSHCAGVTLRRCKTLLLRNRSYERRMAERVPSATEVIGSYLPPDLINCDRMEQPFKACTALNTLRRLKVSVSWLSGHLPLRVKALEAWGIPCDKDVTHSLLDSLRLSVADSHLMTIYNSASSFGEGPEPFSHGAQATLHVRQSSSGPAPPHASVSPLTSRSPSDTSACKCDNRSCCPDSKDRSLHLHSSETLQPAVSCPPDCTATISTFTPGVVPSRLLDEITCDVMHIPMLLPSGHYVDQSTIAKLEEIDLLYGRRPCDPFTGVPFSATNQPVFSAELKCQLDVFLCSPSGSSHGMTVGKSKDIVHHLKLAGGREKRQANDTRPFKPSKRLREDFDGTKLDPMHLPGLSPSNPVLNSADHIVTTSEDTRRQPSRKCGHNQQDQHEAEVAESLTQALETLYSTQPCHSPSSSRT